MSNQLPIQESHVQSAMYTGVIGVTSTLYRKNHYSKDAAHWHRQGQSLKPVEATNVKKKQGRTECSES